HPEVERHPQLGWTLAVELAIQVKERQELPLAGCELRHDRLVLIPGVPLPVLDRMPGACRGPSRATEPRLVACRLDRMPQQPDASATAWGIRHATRDSRRHPRGGRAADPMLLTEPGAHRECAASLGVAQKETSAATEPGGC